MGIQLDRRKLSIMRVSGQGMAEVSMQRSVALPQDLPDMWDARAEAVLWARGVPVITSIEPADGQIRVAGHIHSTLLYAAGAEPGSIHAATFDELRFEAVVVSPGVGPGDDAWADVVLAEHTAEASGSRGLSLAATLSVCAQAARNEAVDVAVAASATGGSKIAVQFNEVTVVTAVAILSEKAECVDKMEIPAGAPPSSGMGAPCGVAGNVKLVSVQVADGRIAIEAEIGLELAYAADRGAPALNIIRRERLPVHKVIDVSEAKKGMSARVSLSITKLTAAAISPREFQIDGVLAVNARLVDTGQVAVVSDIISETQEIVDIETVMIHAEKLVGEGKVDIDLQDSVAVHALMGGRSLTGVEQVKSTVSHIALSEVETLDGEVSVRGIVTARTVFGDMQEDEEGQFPTAFAIDIPVEFSDSVEVPGTIDKDRAEITAMTEAVFIEKTSQSKLDVDGSVRIDVAVYREVTVPVVTAAETITPMKLDPYAMTFYVAGPGDTLARISRRYGVPLDKIASANGMGPADQLGLGQKIYVPAKR
ncbi:MAG: DUF3794 domain-containing protein [Clostridia bacterium]|nr:DUF3794 domain-containing protein [Clostridia bacterium]